MIKKAGLLAVVGIATYVHAASGFSVEDRSSYIALHAPRFNPSFIRYGAVIKSKIADPETILLEAVWYNPTSHTTEKRGVIYLSEPAAQKPFLCDSASFNPWSNAEYRIYAYRVNPVTKAITEPIERISDVIEVHAALPAELRSVKSYAPFFLKKKLTSQEKKYLTITAVVVGAALFAVAARHYYIKRQLARLDKLMATTNNSATDNLSPDEIMAAAYITPEEEAIIRSRIPEETEGHDKGFRGLLEGHVSDVSFLLFKKTRDTLENKNAAISKARTIDPNFDIIVDSHQQTLIKMLDKALKNDEAVIKSVEERFYKPAKSKAALQIQKRLIVVLTNPGKANHEKEMIKQEFPRLVDIYKQGVESLKGELQSNWDYYDPAKLPVLKW